jgi:hypothetical protein
MCNPKIRCWFSVMQKKQGEEGAREGSRNKKDKKEIKRNKKKERERNKEKRDPRCKSDSGSLSMGMRLNAVFQTRDEMRKKKQAGPGKQNLFFKKNF